MQGHTARKDRVPSGDSLSAQLLMAAGAPSQVGLPGPPHCPHCLQAPLWARDTHIMEKAGRRCAWGPRHQGKGGWEQTERRKVRIEIKRIGNRPSFTPPLNTRPCGGLFVCLLN